MCLTPINVKNKRKLNTDYAYETVPCGKCPKCRERRINGWRFRMLEEAKRHDTAIFVTLTYSNTAIPITTNGFMSLSKQDVQRFFKRLRYNTGKKSIRYYAAGEYGPKTFRPHYHAVIFDATHDEVLDAWSLHHKEAGHKMEIGNIKTRPADAASMVYSAKYMSKPSRIPMHEEDDRQPEFSLMSKGMGANYLTPEMVKHHKESLKTTVTNPGGIEQQMPRYYKEKIFTESELNLIGYEARKAHSIANTKEIKNSGGVEEWMRRKHEHVRQQFKKQTRESHEKRNQN